MVFKDYYKILGFDSNKVSLEDIKVAYRSMAKKYHPDMHATSDNPAHAEEIFKDVNEAYRILSNERARRKYDFSWNRYVAKPTTKDKKPVERNICKEIKNMFFGDKIKLKKKNDVEPYYGQDIRTEIKISIEEAFYGCKKEIKLKEQDKKYELVVPAGIKEGKLLKIKGAGERGLNGGKNGDLIVKVEIKDKQEMILDGYDIIYTLRIKPWEAALGNTKNLEILRESLIVKIPECSSSDDKIIINDKGYFINNKNRGKLIIKLKIVMPEKLSQEEKKIYQKLSAI